MEHFCSCDYDSFWQSEVANVLLRQDLGLVCCLVLETPVQVGLLSHKQDAEGSGITRSREGVMGDWPTGGLPSSYRQQEPRRPENNWLTRA